MALKINKLAATTAVVAAFSLLATPVAAADLPKPAAAKVYDGDALNVERHRRWRRNNDVDAGDVIAGVLVLGTIAAIAGAAKNRQRDRYPYPGDRYPNPGDGYPGDEDARYRTPGQYDRSESRGIDRAVDMCVAEVERGRDRDRVDTVDTATRSGDGWRVSGQLEGGTDYSCLIGNDGRISDVQVGSSGYGTAQAEPITDNDWDDDYYNRARAAQSAPPPLPEPYEGDDGRYETAQAPDFEQ